MYRKYVGADEAQHTSYCSKSNLQQRCITMTMTLWRLHLNDVPHEVLMVSRSSAYFHLDRSYFLESRAVRAAWTSADLMRQININDSTNSSDWCILNHMTYFILLLSMTDISKDIFNELKFTWYNFTPISMSHKHYCIKSILTTFNYIRRLLQNQIFGSFNWLLFLLLFCSYFNAPVILIQLLGAVM